MTDDVAHLYGVCEADRCQRQERAITKDSDLIVIDGRRYHRGCEPSDRERQQQ